MPWKVPAVSDVRFALCHAVRTLGGTVTAAAAEFGVSRKTAHKWVAAFDAAGGAAACPSAALADRSRRPRASPGRTGDAGERAILDLRDAHNWGPRKIHAHLRDRDGAAPCSARTVARVLARHGRVAAAPAPPAARRFERPAPNDLWQLDHKGPVEVARRKVCPLAVIDDHSRYCLAFEPLPDRTVARVWDVLWRLFDQAGLPRQVLCDNAFNAVGCERPAGLSWFDARLARLGIDPAHGRPYHPQTQGKVERLNATAARELIYFNARRDDDAHFAADCARWRDAYNTLRPHEALGDVPPVTRWRPSAADRPRPAALPEAASFYPPGAELKTVCREGLIRLDGRRILVGRGVAGQPVRVDRRANEVAVFYCARQVRLLSHDQLVKDRVL